MDDADREILRILQSDNRVSNNRIGQEIGLSVSAVNERVRRLNASGVIQGNKASVDPLAVDLGLCVFVLVDLDTRDEDEEAFVSAAIAQHEIQEAHHITGGHNYLLKVRVKDTSALQTFLVEKLKRMPGVLRTETTVVLQTRKETTELSL